MATVETQRAPITTKQDLGARVEHILQEDGTLHEFLTLSFRNPRHKQRIIEELTSDQPLAFHGWGVSGVAKRVDKDSKFELFWQLKKGRLPGSKIPLLEPDEAAIDHIDWQSVHPNFRYLRDLRSFSKLRSSGLPFHTIFPYQESRGSLSEAVVTPAFDPLVAPETPVPTICLFWINDPALVYLVKDLKRASPEVQIGVSSLNQSHELPPFSTKELTAYLKERKITDYRIVVEDPLLESLDIASSHSQFVAPLDGDPPFWKMKRRGSLSAIAFEKYTGFKVIGEDLAPVTARRHSNETNLDEKLYQAAHLTKEWHKGRFLRGLKETFHLV